MQQAAETEAGPGKIEDGSNREILNWIPSEG